MWCCRPRRTWWRGSRPHPRPRWPNMREARHQPALSKRNAGCIFKNPTGLSAGRLIDQAHLKGLRIGDAEVSPEHGNFLVNHGHATAAEFAELMETGREVLEVVALGSRGGGLAGIIRRLESGVRRYLCDPAIWSAAQILRAQGQMLARPKAATGSISSRLRTPDCRLQSPTRRL
ncbi:MAG: hypothetical protein IPN91_15900 [Holophagaceae bacterium]|uniref:UDP-N-acetylenolpyruvoylglucosamine reductase n=1 Tax=Candidatus Geothrix odensensis TaxID=2954440 RepID=A0A936F4T5_9BACT|nr:hypothetical protein [Candidatus Geothrix odensensis]